jgi:hypothetical protein
MPLRAIVHTPPIRRPTRAIRPDYERFDEAHALADAGDHRGALQEILAHLFPFTALPDLAAQPFTFAHGSSRVTVRLEGDVLAVDVPLVALPAAPGKAIAAMRDVLGRAARLGQLYRARLRGDALSLEFRDRLARLHPTKVLEVLTSMPVHADALDDWLIAQHGARPLSRAPIAPLDDDELSRADAEWRAHWGDVEELVRESQRKCSTFFLDAAGAYAVHRVRYTLPLCGFLSARLDEAAGTFASGEVDAARREAALLRFAREMRAVPVGELAGSLGHAEYGISQTADGTPKLVAEIFGPGEYSDTIEELRSKGQPMDAALSLFGGVMFLLAGFTWSRPVEVALADALVAASGQPWRQAAATLCAHGQKLHAALAAEEEVAHD